MRLLLAALVLTSCLDPRDRTRSPPRTRSDGSVDRPDASETDGGDDRLIGEGLIALSQDPSGYGFYAAFFRATDPDPRGCSEAVEAGPCRFSSCSPGSPMAPYAHAGNISSPIGSGLTLMPGPDGSYMFLDGTTALFSGGEEVLIFADGAEVPAFTTAVTAPSHVVVVAPEVPPDGTTFEVARDAELLLSWSPSEGVFHFTFSMGGVPRFDFLDCSFDATNGSGTVPSEALLLMPAGRGSIGASVEGVAMDRFDGWQITLTVADRSTAAAGHELTNAFVDFL